MTFYHYPACGTCRRARAWLATRSIPFDPVHIVEHPPTRQQIEEMWRQSGLDLKRFFNTSGGSYRALNLKETYKDLSDEARLDLLAADGKLLKRPLLQVDDRTVLVGFKEAEYSAALQGVTPS